MMKVKERSDRDMNRRHFIGSCIVAGMPALFASERKTEPDFPSDAYAVIEAVQQHMFPEGNLLPGAKRFHATPFLAETVMHPSYDKDIRVFVIEGAEELQTREKQKFLNYDEAQREKALRSYEETVYGSGWLDRILLLSLEGLLSDPLYGGNYGMSGWKALETRGGEPRPTVRYAAQ